MLKFLKRLVGRQPTRRPASSGARAQAARLWQRLTGPSPLDPLPVGEVHELHGDSAWDQWEHSQMELDSRMGGVSAFDSIRVKDGGPTQAGDLDPFEAVRKRK